MTPQPFSKPAAPPSRAFRYRALLVFGGFAALLAALMEQGAELRSTKQVLADIVTQQESVSTTRPKAATQAKVLFYIRNTTVVRQEDTLEYNVVDDAPVLKTLGPEAQLESFYIADPATFALMAAPPTYMDDKPGGDVWYLDLVAKDIRDTGVPNRHWHLLKNSQKALGYGMPDAKGEVRQMFLLDLLTQKETVLIELPADQSFTAALDSRGRPEVQADATSEYHLIGPTYSFPVYSAKTAPPTCKDAYQGTCAYRAPIAQRIYAEGQ